MTRSTGRRMTVPVSSRLRIDARIGQNSSRVLAAAGEDANSVARRVDGGASSTLGTRKCGSNTSELSCFAQSEQSRYLALSVSVFVTSFEWRRHEAKVLPVDEMMARRIVPPTVEEPTLWNLKKTNDLPEGDSAWMRHAAEVRHAREASLHSHKPRGV